MNSPRSLEACRQLGILPEELYFQDFDTYIKLNPEVIGLPKDIQRIRFENIDKYRKETIKMVKDQRDLIINNRKEKEKEQNNNNETSDKMNINENNIIENKTIYNLDEQLNNIMDKEKKNLEKLKRRQKNEIEAEIETKIKSEMIRQKAEEKEKRIQEMNEKIKEKLEEKAKKELPPILSANPDNEMLGKINREERVLKMDLPTFASPDDVRKSLGDSHHGSALPPAPTHMPTPKKRPAPTPVEADFEEDFLPVDKSED